MYIILLILKIIELILTGESTTDAVRLVSNDSGVSFKELRDRLPNKYK
ncbi:MAG: hypothetical protein JJT76_06460 [Clostridiaceae bacterium]|nr:hypothetical protein [Clostridiaceae bacterium]